MHDIINMLHLKYSSTMVVDIEIIKILFTKRREKLKTSVHQLDHLQNHRTKYLLFC